MGKTLAAALAFVLVLSPEAALARGKKKSEQAQKKDEAAPVIEHTPVSTHDGQSPVHIVATIRDDSGVFEPTLVVRKKGGAYVRVPMVPGSDAQFSADVPMEMLDGDVEYFVEAFDTNGNGPARAGDEAAPFVVTSTRPPAPETASASATTTPSGTAPGATPGPAEEDGGGNTGLLVAAGVITGVVVLLGAGAGVGFLVYSLRPKAPDTTRVSVSGPTPVAAAAP